MFFWKKQGEEVNDKVKEIVRLRNSGMTLKTIGEDVGFTTERIRQILFKYKRVMGRVETEDIKHHWDNRLGTRVMNALKNNGIDSFEKLYNTPEKELLKYKNFGEKCLIQVQAYKKWKTSK